MRIVRHRFPTSGNADGLAPGTRINCAPVLMRKVAPGTLSAEVTVDVETPSLTFALVWQGSDDREFTEPIDLAGNEANDAPVPLATGTAVVLPAPRAVYGFRYARAQLLVGGATGTASDTFQLAYGFGDPATARRKRRT